MTFEFIPCNPDSTLCQKDREIEQARARSHAARVSHRTKWRQQKGHDHYSRSNGDNAQFQHASISDSFPAIGSEIQTVAPVSNKHHRERHLDNIMYRRSDDWFFGSLGPSCRRISNDDFFAITYHLGSQFQELSFGNGIFENYSDFLAAQEFFRPLNVAMILHALNNASLLDSLVASAMLSMACLHPEALYIRQIGDRMTLRALRHLRVSLKDSTKAETLDNKAVIFNLAISALSTGDFDAARAHLSVLTAIFKDLHIPDAQQGWLLYQIHIADLRIALEIGERPKSAMSWTAQTLQAFLANIVGVDALPAMPTQTFDQQYDEAISFNDGSIAIEEELRFQRNICTGFESIAEAGLIPGRIIGVLNNYKATLLYLHQISCTSGSGLWKVSMATNTALRCLHRTCTYWYETGLGQNLLERTDNPKLDCSTSDHPGVLETLIIVTLQIHLVSRIGTFLKPTLRVLCQRLRASIESLTSGLYLNYIEQHYQYIALRFGLYAWALLSGILAASNDKVMREWLRNEYSRAIVMLRHVYPIRSRYLIAPFVFETYQTDIMALSDRLDEESIPPPSTI